MNQLFNKIEGRLDFGRAKYGHGVRINDDMSNYTRSNINSFLSMQEEEILDGIIYTAASKLRWLSNSYNIDFDKELDNNDDIKEVINDVINNVTKFIDSTSLSFDKLLSSMILVYCNTITLSNQIDYLKDTPIKEEHVNR